jgi:hypothetical protein
MIHIQTHTHTHTHTHKQQLEGKILSRCNSQVFVIDVGISSYYGGHCAALEIFGDTVTALYCDGPYSTKAVRVDMSPDPEFEVEGSRKNKNNKNNNKKKKEKMMNMKGSKETKGDSGVGVKKKVNGSDL